MAEQHKIIRQLRSPNHVVVANADGTAQSSENAVAQYMALGALASMSVAQKEAMRRFCSSHDLPDQDRNAFLDKLDGQPGERR